jgi:Flp pilus assembly protein CpaB
LWSDLAKENAGGISTAIASDQRAYTASITRGIKAGLIAVSDHVDIIGSFTVPKSPIPLQPTAASWKQSPDMVNVVLLQNVTVLAVGDVTSGMNRSEGTMGDLTFALTLPESQLMMFASEHGELGVVLRSQGAVDVLPRKELKRVTFDSIEQIIGDLDGRRSQRLVGVQKGADVEVVPVRSTTPDLATPLETGVQK